MGDEIIAGRYRVERALAVGGMGEVLVVEDRSTERKLALKRLLPTKDSRIVGMFEREYHALASLRHPRIIAVHEYGVSGDQPYYTMELLDGQDLRKLGRLDYVTACRYLRDVATSLALLHARKLLHRDVGPRNIRVTSDDRVKLIDFGAMMSFGVADVVVGTPPYVAPEALRAGHLDQQSDLFSLGAVGYWLLTGKNAFPAHALTELPELWRKPPAPPSQWLDADPEASHLPRVPAALDELILALLTPNPVGRPASAVEVIERLEVIAKLTPDSGAQLAGSYLVNGALIGRRHELQRVHKRVSRALSGQGSCVLIDAEPGMGSTRLLSEVALHAQLAGVTPIVIDAKQHRDVYGTARALAEQVLLALPEESRIAARGHGDVLARVSPAFRTSVSESPGRRRDLPPGELRQRTQDALSSWLLAVCSQHPLLLAIDNVQRADEASAALLATLGAAARDHALLLVAARQPREVPTSAPAMRVLEQAGPVLRLRALSRDGVHELVSSLFGNAQNQERLADFLHGLSGGNPRACLALIHHLCEAHTIRFVDSLWVLPHELSAEDLPASLDELLDARLSVLSPDARCLAEALSVHRGALGIELCLKLAQSVGINAPHIVLDALVREEVLVQNGSSYYFAHDAARERLQETLDDAVRQKYHAHFGRLLLEQLAQGPNARLDAGFHLLRAGEERRGAELLAAAGMELAHRNDEIPAAVPALIAALSVFKQQGRSNHDLVGLLGSLAVAGYRVDHSLADRFGDEAIAAFQDVIGLRTAARLRPWLGARVSVWLGVGSGFVRACFAYGVRAPAELVKIITLFVTAVTTLVGTACICLDSKRARHYAAALEPLSALGERHPANIAYEFAQILAALPQHRIAEVVRGCERVAARLEDKTRPVRGLPESALLLLRGGVYYAMGTMSSYRDDTTALACADKLDGLGLRLYAMAADQVRTMHHALRGELALANRFRRRVESHAIAAGTAWQAEMHWPPTMVIVCLLTRDMLGVKACCEQIERMALDTPSLAYFAKLGRGVHHYLKGNAQQAYDTITATLAETPGYEVLGAPASVAVQALALCELGHPAQAKRLAQQMLDAAPAGEQPFIGMYQQLHIALALCDLALGDVAAAKQRLLDLIEQHKAGEGPLTLGNLHGACVRVALSERDVAAARAHLQEARRWFTPTGNHALIAQCERFARAIDRLERPVSASTMRSTPRSTIGDALTGNESGWRSAFSQCASHAERIELALKTIVDQLGGMRAYLFAYDSAEQRLSLVGPSSGEEPPSQLMASIDNAAASALGDDEATEVVSEAETVQPAMPARVEADGLAYRTLLLRARDYSVVGAVAVLDDGSLAGSLSVELLRAIAELVMIDPAATVIS